MKRLEIDELVVRRYSSACFQLPRHAMYSSTFTYAARRFDDEFHRLDQQIATAARAIDGYLGQETWESPSTGRVSNIYYWRSLEALEQLMHHPAHLEAKAAQARWLDGYHVVIAQVLRTYGDGALRPAQPLGAA